ncbi:IPT/TIG domain-containing protein [Geothrix limicola]|uniref:IPT/TIG domain-containing protein n=1 Tax=Geothrix limicola TaxID=2927978 RepID=UPI002552BA71|nr:IPT/TIG domain-containing protein [Geothrix limicola]
MVISGNNFASASAVAFNGTAAAAFTVNNATQITATVPSGATSGAVSVTTPNGTGSGPTFTVTASAPTVTGLNPTSGPVGSSVVITGTNLTNASAVSFNGTPASGFTVNSATQITTTVPAGATSGTVSVTAPGGTAAGPGFTVTASAPTVSNLSPTSGVVGSSVVITGTNLSGASAVAFNGTPAAAFAVNSATQITATVPVGATSGAVSVTTAGGTATGPAFTVTLPTPTVFSLTPANGLVGSSVVIAGTNLSGATAVTFNGTAAVYTVNSATQITATVPAGATTGAVNVTTPGGTAVGPVFTVTPPSAQPPTLTQLNPTSGAPGSTTVLTGTNLTNASAVSFNGTPAASFTVTSATQITVTVPAGATTGPVSVTTPGGTAAGPSFTVTAPAPTVTGLNPTSGQVGSSVTITGTNLTNASAVSFNGTPATSFTVTSATQITATVPAGATTGTVSVTTPGGTAAGPTFTVTTPAPTVTGLNPTSGQVGSSVTITGTNLTNASAVSFNGTPAASFTVTSATQITATVPAGATTGPVSVTTPGGTAAGPSFTVTVPVPTVTSLNPTGGQAGSSVTITGTGLTNASAVSFNGTPAASFTVTSATQITATVPAGATTGPVSVTTPGGTATGPAFLVLAPAPTITGLNPTSGMVGSSVTITGTNLTGATAVAFDGTAATFTVNSATQITATVPVGAHFGEVSVTTPGGTAMGPFFTVSPSTAPTLSGINWPAANVGVNVILTGTNLSGATLVSFNGTAASAFTVNSPTQITVTVPVGATSGAISVTTPGGTALGPLFTVTSDPAPAITNFGPNPMTDYHALLVSGTNLLNGSRVYIGNALVGVMKDSWTGNTGNYIYDLPVGTLGGKIRLEGPNGTAFSATDLAFNFSLPTVASLSPTSGYPGSSVTVTGTNLKYLATVSFNGVPSVPTSWTDTQVVVLVPAGASTGTVRATNASGSADGPTFTVLAAPAPTLTDLSPAFGQPGNLLTLTGTNFFGTSAVSFNGTPAVTYTVLSPTQITVIVPDGASTGPVSVTTPSGTAVGPVFTSLPDAMMPRINDFNPSEGGNWATIYITGVNLQTATNVDIAGKGHYSWNVVNDNLIKALVYWTGTTDVTGPITVTTPSGPITSPRNFTIKGYPAAFDMAVSSIVPNHGKPFDHVQINGTALDTVTSIYFGDCNGMMQASFKVLSPTALDVTLPGRLVTGKVCLFTPHNIWGCYTTADVFTADSIAAQGVPVIDSFSPMSSDRNWTLITVKGSHFTGATKVEIGGSGPGDFFYVIDDNTLQIQTPMWSQTGPIKITTPAGTGVSAQNFVGPYLPGFWTLSPDNHGKEGDVYRLNVAYAPGVKSISFGGVPAPTFTQVDSYRLDVTIPVGALTGYLSLTNTDPVTGNTNTAWSYDNFFIAPTLTGMSPATGTVGTTVSITGRNFQDTTSVTFGGVPATRFKIVSGSLIQAVVPAGAVSGPIALLNRLGDGGATASSFQVVNPAAGPVVAEIFPATAAPGEQVLLSGKRLSGTTAVSLGGANASFTVLSDASLLVTVPAGAATGLAHVSTPGGSVDSYGTFTPQADRMIDLLINGDFELGDVNWHGSFGSGPLIQNSLTMPAYNLLPQSGTWAQTVGGWGWGAPRQGHTRTIDAPVSDAVAIPADATKVELRFVAGLVTEENTGTAKDFFNVKLLDAATDLLLPGGQVLQLDNLSGSDHVLKSYVVDITAFRGRSVKIRMESDEDLEMRTAWTMDDVQLLVYGSTSAVPSVVSIFPTTGYPEETVVTLNGVNLRGIQQILFNGVPAHSWNQIDSETVEATAAFGSSTGPVVVISGAGATALPGTFTVTYHQPVANHVEPTRGPVGTPVALLGQHLRGTTSVTINGLAMAFTVDSDGQISTVIPAGATTGSIQISGPGGTASTEVFTVLANGTTADLYIDRVEFVQVTQREDGAVPMVKDRQALARVHVKGNTANTLLPSVKLSLFQGSTKVYETLIACPAGLTGTPTSTSTADFDKTWNATIPAQYMQPGVGVLAQVNPDGSQPEVDATNNVWPYDGTPEILDVRDTQMFKLTMVPLSMVVNGQTWTGDVNTNNLPTWTGMFQAVWPLPDAIDIQVHAPYNTQHVPLPDYSYGWMEVLAELKALRLAEVGNSRYYYGALNAWWWDNGAADRQGGGSGMADSLGVLQAMGIGHEYGGTKSPYTWRAGTLAHELGHALSRPHTPCGNAGSPDNSYPYDNGVIGAWGYGFGTNGNEDGGANINIWDASKYHDIMGYCGFEWVSDYCYRHVMDYRLNYDLSITHGPIGTSDPAPLSSAKGVGTTGMQDCLMIWGQVENGDVKLFPSMVIKSIPSEPDPEATYQAEVFSQSGASLGRLSFEPGEPDHGPRIHGFNVLMPLAQLAGGKGLQATGAPTASAVASIRIHRNGEKLAEQARPASQAANAATAGATAEDRFQAVRLPDGKVRFTWDAAVHALVMIKNEKGEVIAFAKGGSMDLVTDARTLDIHFSDDPTSTGRSLSVR